MPKKFFFLVDDDPEILQLMAAVLTDKGYKVKAQRSSMKALQEIIDDPPDCVIIDIIMPEIDGLRFVNELHKKKQFKHTKFIIISAKTYSSDCRQAIKAGAHGFLQKPINPDTVVDDIMAIMSNRLELTFWGVHGSLPTPGPKNVRYGGNTSCVSLKFPDNSLFIFDAGTGIKVLSDKLIAAGLSPINGHIFISHPHWDHINAIMFFAPLYTAGNKFTIYGINQGTRSFRDCIKMQMDDVFFPVLARELGAEISYEELTEGTFTIKNTKVQTLLLSHPGYCLGFRINFEDFSICYVTDNEVFPEDHPRHDPYYKKKLIAFIKNTDILITDSTYTDKEYVSKIGWGHSTISEVINFAHQAHVKNLYLFHHDPNQTDDDIDKKYASAKTLLTKMRSKIKCFSPKEGDTIIIEENKIIKPTSKSTTMK